MDFTEYDVRLAAYAVVNDSEERILLSWYNGAGHSPPGWTPPGGGVEFDESGEEAIVREVHEETGYLVALDAPLAMYAAHVVGGRLGTLEVGGTTDCASWMPLDEVSLSDPRAVILNVAIRAWRDARQSR